MAALGTLNPLRRNPNSSSNPQERRRATSATRCYGCGQYSHFKSDCPRPCRKGPRRFATRAKLECLHCKGDHFVRNCPSLPAVQQATKLSGQARETEPQKQVTVPSARPSVPDDYSATFKRDTALVLSESPSPDDQLTQADSPPSSEPTPQSESPVQVIDPALPAMSPESTPKTPRMQLFFIL